MIPDPLRLRKSTRRTIGGLMLAHFGLVCVVKIAAGIAGEILWMSHIGLLMAAAGLLLDRPLLVATALIDVLVLHGLWLADCLGWALGGDFPLGITTYLRTAGWTTWAATAHHFYLVPLLLVLVRPRAVRTPDALLAATAVYLGLTVISRACVSPALNVNFAFGVNFGPQVPLLAWGNRQPGSVYLPLLNAFVAFVMFTPAFIVLRDRSAESHGQQLRRIAAV
ncbi:MAG TPA: hypothetical protein P5572_05230 [Phycisphaerae bacterium]|nr:hypothetical protein [Phycisphaerales bacterium]HRX84404.1 hypothetical protein [Phycisphaerae bacterium]